MKSIEDTLQEIDELIIREEEILEESRKDGGDNCYAAGYSRGALEVLRELRLWLIA